MAIAGVLSPPARAALSAQSMTLMSRVVAEPDAWVVTAHATSG